MSKTKKKPVPAKSSAPIRLTDNSYLHYALLFACTLILFGWTSAFKFNLDDDYILTYLFKVNRDFDGLLSIFRMWFANSDYRPVTILSFWFERALFGEIRPSTSHLINVILYGIDAILLYRLVLVSRFFEDSSKNKTLALLSGLIFIVHTNHVSVVANVKSRDNLQSMLFGILAAIQLIKLYDTKAYRHVPLFFLFILLGLFSKLDAYAFILYAILVVVMYRKVDWKKTLRIVGGGFFLVLFSFAIVKIVTLFIGSPLKTYSLGIADSPVYNDNSIIHHLSLGLTSMLYYLKFLFIPTGYYYYFGYKEIELLPFFSLLNMLCLLLLLLMFALSVYAFKRNRIYLFCYLFFGLAIAYALNIYTMVSGIVMDRYNFIPSLAFCIALAGLLIDLHANFKTSVWKSPWTIGILLVFSAFTYYRTSAWKDPFTLFDRDVPHLSKSIIANRIAGGFYIHYALQEEMKANYDRALTDSLINKGERYARIALNNSDETPQVWELLGLCDLYRKDNVKALEKFRKCYTLDTSYLSGINYIGFTYWNLGQTDSAYRYFNYVMQRENFFNYAANNMINMLVKNGRKREADSILSVLQKRYPDDPRLNDKIREVNPSNTPVFKTP